jgi:hypothetical protein
VNERPIDRFRRRFAEEVPGIARESEIADLVADPTSGDPPRLFPGVLRSVEHFERRSDGTIHASSAPIFFVIELPDDYCSCVDGSLQLRVATVCVPLFHPNVSRGGIVCLGPRFRPSTRVRPLLDHLYAICASRVFASESPWDAESGSFYRNSLGRVRALRAAPLWRQPLAARARVEPLPPRPPQAGA